VRSAKADSTTAAPDPASNVSGSQSATTKATVETTPTETSPMETTATAKTTSTTTMEASSTTAAVPGGPCYGTERHERDAN
jgi:hypothetical protein